MARRSLGYPCLVVLLMIALAGCGVKGPPLARSELAPQKVNDLRARTVSDGVELSFTIPQFEEPEKQITTVKLYFAYLPLTGDPECPPCPPYLKRYIELSLLGEDNKLQQGGGFAYLDRKAPMNKDAFYQVELVDASGRESLISNLAHSPRVTPPSRPTGLKAESGDGVVKLGWNGLAISTKMLDKDGLQGWVVYRRNGDEEKLLVGRPLRVPELADKTVENGVIYSYRVAAVHSYNKIKVEGETTEWVEARPQDSVPPSAPTDLMAAGSNEGVNLRFSPSKDQDVAGYLIYRATSPDGPWTKLGGSGPHLENVFTDSSAQKGNTYYYKVRALDVGGNQSEDSEVITLIFN